MSSNSMDELLSRLEQSSSTYADRATQLSDMILEFESRLHCAMDGKFSACVKHEDPQEAFKLGYDRVDGRWRLCFARVGPVSKWRPLQEAAVSYKILGAALFEDLLKEILDKQEEQTEELNAALDGISPFLDDLAHPEGGE